MKKIVIMLVCAAFLLSGCGKKENEVEPPSDTGKSYVEFVQTDYAVGVDAEIQLTLNSENAESITFVSSLPEIASVSPNGVVSGLKLGRTEITATAVSTGKGGERLSAKCSVFVNPGEYEKLDARNRSSSGSAERSYPKMLSIAITRQADSRQTFTVRNSARRSWRQAIKKRRGFAY